MLRNIKINRLSRFFSQNQKVPLREGNILNPHLIQLEAVVKNKTGILSNLLSKLKKMNLNLHNIESNFKMGDWENAYVEIFLEDLKKKRSVEEILEKVNIPDCMVKEKPTLKIPDFPVSLSDLDRMSMVLFNLDESLNKEHPGFRDIEYRERRNYLAQVSKDYKMGQPIKRIDYSKVETDLWGRIYDKLRGLMLEHGVKEYVDNLKILEKEGIFKRTAIPQLEDINNFLIKKTNWRIKPVSGILSQREYLNCLAFRTFPCTQYIRHHTRPDYTPEPDLVHEFFGHIPSFCDPVFCDISQELGILSLGQSDSVVKLVGSLYWFTIEFGLTKEDGKMKIYGGGIGSSSDEIHNALTNKDIRHLNIHKEFPPTEFVVTKVQPYFYYTNSQNELLDQLRGLNGVLAKPFKYAMNKDSTELYIDRKLETFAEDNKIDIFNV